MTLHTSSVDSPEAHFNGERHVLSRVLAMSAGQLVDVSTAAWGGNPHEASDLGQATGASFWDNRTSLGGAAVTRMDFEAEYARRRAARLDSASAT
jgi:hypothetical protein